jgi:hypothetical protein
LIDVDPARPRPGFLCFVSFVVPLSTCILNRQIAGAERKHPGEGARIHVDLSPPINNFGTALA